MDFTASTTVTVHDQETGEILPFDEWSAREFEIAGEYVRDEFATEIIPIYDPLGSRGTGFSQSSSDAEYVDFSQPIEIDAKVIASHIDDVSGGVATENADRVRDVETERVGEDVVVRGRVYGDHAKTPELQSRVFSAITCDIDADLEIVQGEEHGMDGWHQFYAQIPLRPLLIEEFSESEIVSAITTGDGGVELELGR